MLTEEQKAKRLCILDNCNKRHKAKGYCNKHYQTFLKYGDVNYRGKIGQPRKFMSVWDNFKSRFTKGSKDECWEWTGPFDKDGYGEFCAWMSPGYKKFRATRVSITYYRGDLVDDMLVCHTCDNPACVNPNHLFQGTAQDNATDMVNKKRSMFGERNYKAKLTKEDVFLIRENLSKGVGNTLIARQYNVHVSTIERIKYNETWKHLEQ